MYAPTDTSLGRSELLARCDGCEIDLVDGEALSKGTAGGADWTTRCRGGGRARRRSVGVRPRSVGKLGPIYLFVFISCEIPLYEGLAYLVRIAVVSVEWDDSYSSTWARKILSTAPGKPTKDKGGIGSYVARRCNHEIGPPVDEFHRFTWDLLSPSSNSQIHLDLLTSSNSWVLVVNGGQCLGWGAGVCGP